MEEERNEYSVEDLYGRESAPEEEVLKGMAPLERDLASQFEAKRREEEEMSRYMANLGEALIPKRAQDRFRQSAEGLQQLDAEAGKSKPSPPEVEPPRRRIFLSSIGATLTPPYNYQWTWDAQSGSPALDVSADKNTGEIEFDIWNNSNDASGSARTAVGIYFRPMVDNGILKLRANPAFNYLWWTYCVMRSAHSSAFIGLYVGRYTLAGGFDGAPVDQKISLWSDDSWWSGAGSNNGSTSGYPLSAEFDVSSSYYYAMWVWCGGRASGKGWGTFSGSGAGSKLSVTVPSISWELFGG